MIDIHSHIIFDVDDGPKTFEDSKKLLEESYRQGVRTIISTSHRRKGMFETPEETISANFKMVKELAELVAPDLTVLYGAELYYTSDVADKLEKGIFPSLAGTRYVLIEFTGLAQILRLGLTPVLAHIERYHCLENDEKKVQELINMGCYTQINSSSVLKPKLLGDSHKFMKKRAQFFLEKDLVHFVASDMHNLSQRPPFMKEAFDIVAKKYGSRRAEALFGGNQALLLKNELI